MTKKPVFALMVLVAVALGCALGVVGVVVFRAVRNRRPVAIAASESGPVAADEPVPAAPVPAATLRASPVISGAGSHGTDPDPAVKLDTSGSTAATEAALMERLRGLEESDPPLTLRLAREGNARFPDSPDAPERAWMAVKALANMQRFGEAHDEAQTMVNRYPGTAWSQDVQRHLLASPL